MFMLKCYLIFKNWLHVTADDVTVTFWQTAIYTVYKLSLNYPSFKAIAGPHWIHLPAGQRASTHVARNAAQRTELAADQLSRFHHQRPVAFKFAGYEPNGLSCVGCNVGSLPQAQNKAEDNRWTQASASGYLGQPATGTDRQGCKRFLKQGDWRLVLLLGAGGEHFEHSQWRWNFGIWSLVNCVVSTMLLNWRWNQNIFECQKRQAVMLKSL